MNEVKKTWTYNSWFKLLNKEVFNVYYLKWVFTDYLRLETSF